MDVITKNAKAWVAATVAFVASLVALKLGFEIPLEWQAMITAAVMSAVSYVLTWLVPNKQ